MKESINNMIESSAKLLSFCNWGCDLYVASQFIFPYERSAAESGNQTMYSSAFSWQCNN